MNNPITLKEAFDKIWNTWIVEKKCNDSNSAQHVYEHLPTGCFIGHLLTKKQASVLENFAVEVKRYSIEELLEFTDRHIEFVSKELKEIVEYFSNIDKNLLSQLQVIHDETMRTTGNRSFNFTHLEKRLTRFGIENNLIQVDNNEELDNYI